MDGDESLLRAPSRRAMLRDHTQAAHAALDALIDTSGWFDSRDGYGTFLQAMTTLHRVAGAALARADDRDAARFHDAVAIDAALASDRAVLRVDAGATRDTLASSPSRGATFGIAYVLLGSGLGARVLVRRAQALGFDASRGAAFLTLQSRAVAPWSAFLANLEAATLAADDVREMNAAADATFALATRCVRACLDAAAVPA